MPQKVSHMTKHTVSRSAFTKAITRRVREERLTELALIVQFLGFVLPDTAESREAIADVFSGEHRRVACEVAA
jgi:hypothetical protein